ncbi:MAG: NADH-quinone oxidoreductase subunit N [Acidimicrobiales bacterium]
MNLLAQVPSGGPLRPLDLPDVEYSAMAPALILIGGALLALLVVSLVRRPPPWLWCVLTLATGAAAGAASLWLWFDVRDDGPVRAVADALVVDGFAVFFMVLISTTVILGALLGHGFLEREGVKGPEFYVLMMLSASGGIFMASANDLIVVFLGLEILSIALYVLAGFQGRRSESREAAMKYFVLGAFSSALFLYGIALVYGATGSTNLVSVGQFLAGNVATSNGVLLAGMVLLLVGLGFKVAVVPFHTWTPDVYQGSPSPVTGFMAAAAKAAGFSALLRIFFSTFSTLRLDWQPVIWVLAVVTLLVGSVLALVQTDVKRMLAYSSISHAGYVMIGLQAASARGIAGSLFYLLAYTFMVLGSFAIVTVVGRRGDARHGLEDYRGLAAQRPALALAFAVFLMAQAGVPFTTGFLAKFYVISAAVESESYALALIGMISAVVAAFFYLRLIVLMYTPRADGQPAPTPLRLPVSHGLALGVAVVFTVGFGLLPSAMIHFARQATLLL